MANPFDIAEANLSGGAAVAENPFDVAEKSLSFSTAPNPFDVAATEIVAPLKIILPPPNIPRNSEELGAQNALATQGIGERLRQTFISDTLAKAKTPEQVGMAKRLIEDRLTPDLPTPGTVGQVNRGIGEMLHNTGKAVGDITKAYAFEAIAEPDLQMEQLTGKDPWEAGRKSLPLVPRAAAGAVSGLIETTPQLAIAAVNPVAGGLSFGFTPDGFDPVSAGTMLLAPGGGKIIGKIASKLAAKMGITSEAAQAIIDRAGGAAGVAGLMSAPSIYQISQMPEGEARNSAIEDTAANALVIGVMGALGHRGNKPPEGEVSNPAPQPEAAKNSQAAPNPFDVAEGKARPVADPAQEILSQIEGNVVPPRTVASDPVPDALNKLRAEASGETQPTIAEKAAANPTATPTMADLAAMVAEIKNANPFKPQEKPENMPLGQKPKSEDLRANTVLPENIARAEAPSEPVESPETSQSSPPEAATAPAAPAATGNVSQAVIRENRITEPAPLDPEKPPTWTDERWRIFKKQRQAAIDAQSERNANFVPPTKQTFKVGDKVIHDGVVKTVTKALPGAEYIGVGNRAVKVSELKPAEGVGAEPISPYTPARRARLEKTAAGTGENAETARKLLAKDPTWKPPATDQNPTSPVSLSAKAEQLALRLEDLKSGVGKGGQLHAFGLAADLWDRAVSIAQGVIRAGGSIAEAITAAIAHIKENHKTEFEEDKARFALMEAAQKEGGKEAPERERTAAEVFSDLQAAEAALRVATGRKEGQTQAEYKQAAAVAGARYRTLRDELKLHPERIAETLKSAARLSAEARAARDAGNHEKARQLEDEVQGHADDLARLPQKMVARIQDELIAKGELPKMREMVKSNAGRTLQAMTDALNSKTEFDSPRRSFIERLDIAKKAVGKYTAAKDFTTKAWGNSVAASKAIWSMFKSAPLPTEFKDVMKSWIGYDTRTAIENSRYVRAITAKVKEKDRRMAISVWLDAAGDMSLLKFQRDSVPENYRPVWEAALNLTPDEKQLAREVRANFSQKLEDGMMVGIIGKGRELYGVPQRWKKSPQIDAGDISGEKRGKPGNPYAKLDPRDPFWSFQRNTPSYFEGIMQKGEPENLDIAHLVSVYDEAFHKALSSRGAIKALSEATARDGQPVVKISGKADIRTGDNPGVFVDSKSLPKDAVSADGRPYVSVDHWALRDWKFAAKDNEGRPIVVRGDQLVHPDHADFLRNELNTPRWTTRQAQGIEKVGRVALQASSYLKASKFIGPFHIVTEALHASFHGVVPSVKGFEINLDDANQALLSRNMMIDMGRARDMYDDGVRSMGGGVWKHVPGLGDAIVRMNNYTFNSYVPLLKMKVGLAVLERNRARYSKDSMSGKALTEDQIAELTGRQMDAAFGGQNWRLLGANKNVLAITRLGLVAPDFLISRAKVVGQFFRPYNAEQRVFLMAQAVGVYVLARILNSLFSDDKDPHFELKNWDRVVIGKRAYAARFIVADAGNLARDLLGLGSFNQHGIPFITGRLGVLPKMGMETLSGKDLFTGANKDGLFDTENPALKAFSIVAADTAEWMTPMGVDGFLPGAAAKGQTGLGSAVVATVGVSSRKENATGEVWDLARDYNLNHGDAKAVKFQTDRDNRSGPPSDYRALDNLLDAGQPEKAKAEYEKLLKQGRTAEQIKARYDRSLPFTGNSTRETDFVNSLTEAQKKTYQRAREEQRARREAFKRLVK